MKRFLCVLSVIVLGITLIIPVSAEEVFVPSISYKGAPTVVTIQKPDGGTAIGVVQSNNTVDDYIDEDCLVITPVGEAEESDIISEAAKEMLLDVYEKLSDGTMKPQYEKLESDAAAGGFVIRDLFDVSWHCKEHPDAVAPSGVQVKLVFDLGVDDSTQVYCMTYKNDTWNPIVSTKNIGDGKVECVFEDFCPVAFIVRQKTPPAQTGDSVGLTMPVWTGILVVSTCALIALLLFKRKREV